MASHSLQILHLLLTMAKPILLSLHASFTPSVHLKCGFHLPLAPPTANLHTFLVSCSSHSTICSTCPNRFKIFWSTLIYSFPQLHPLSLTATFLILFHLIYTSETLHCRCIHLDFLLTPLASFRMFWTHTSQLAQEFSHITLSSHSDSHLYNSTYSSLCQMFSPPNLPSCSHRLSLLHPY